MRNRLSLFIFLFLFSFLNTRAQTPTPTPDNRPDEVKASERLEWRSIGPSNMSGRVADVVGVPGNPNIVYVGSASGGVWKTTNGGNSWSPIFDRQGSQSIGAIALEPNNSNSRVHLAEAYLSLNRKEDAKKQLEYVVQMKPDADHLPEHKVSLERAQKLLKSRF